MSNNRDAPAPKLTNMRTRIITSIVLLPIVFAAGISGGIAWAVLAAIVSALCMVELSALMYGEHWKPYAGVALTGGQALLWSYFFTDGQQIPIWAGVFAACLMGAWGISFSQRLTLRGQVVAVGRMLFALVYVGVAGALVLALRLDPLGMLWVVVALALAAGTDTLAYLGGNIFGKRKLAPILSPNKTIEGAVIGLVGGGVLALLFLAVANQLNGVTLLVAVLGPFAAVGGDLFESAMKRYFQVKDSYVGKLNLIPGHGGVLDRTDSTLFIVPLMYILLTVGGILA